ncbi:MAG TPA: TonB-dependent receptor [Sphingobacteriaceae bacterium]
MKQKLLAFLLMGVIAVSTAFAQDRTITGKVVGADDGLPLPGVSVRVKGGSQGTTTDLQGVFSLNVPSGANTLTFTYIGYATQDVALGTSNRINVRLVSDAQQLSEVVVTGYGTTTKAASTGASAQVGGEELQNAPMTSFDKPLQGRVAGLQSIGASGQPGSSQDIRIRGVGSMSASSSPLFVIDGVPINSGDLSRNTTTANALSGINPNDIESVTVLKDASAAAIYGSRAANGVIVVTTRNGKAGKTRIHFDAEGGVSSRAYYNENTRMMNTEEMLLMAGEGLRLSPVYGPAWGITEANQREIAIDAFGLNPDVNTDWYDEVTHTGKSQQYNLSIDGGNENTQFRISGGYFDQDAIIRTAGFKRINGGININHKLNQKLSLGTNLLVSQSQQVGPLNSGNFANPVLGSLFITPDYAPYDEQGNPNLFSGLYNPVAILAMDKNLNNTLKSIGSVTGTYNILPNFKFTSKFGIDYNNLEEDSYNNPTYGDGEGVGYSTRYYTRYFNWISTNLFSYDWDVNKDNVWVAKIQAGYEAQKSKYYSSNVYTSVFPDNIDMTAPSIGATPLTASGTNESYTFASLLSLADISYKGKYVLSGSFRRDGSSRFGSENRYGNFWSVGASWNADQEEFIKNITWIDRLKLRASYGTTGNAGIGNYAWRPLYSYGSNYGGQLGSAPSSIGNEGLTWEQNTQMDIGADLSFFKNRLNITADYYEREAKDLLLNMPISRTSGFSTYTNNIGAMKNSGVEFAISGSPVVTADFKWDLSFNISRNKNEITALVDNRDQTSSPFIRRVGEDFQSYYMPVWAGVDPANGNPLWYTDDSRTTTTSNWNQAAYQLTGKTASPKAFGGAGTTFTYKGLSLDALFYYNFGNHIYDPYYQYLNSGGAYIGSYNQRITEMNRWQKPGDITDVPRYVYGGTNAYRLSTRILNKGDFIRLRDVTLGYNLPKNVISRARLTNARLYVRGTNIWTSAADENLPYDPEAGGVSGLTNFDINVPKTITVGVNLAF